MKVTDKITITNEDNMELMARYEDNHFDLAIVDPPYGINLGKNGKNSKEWGLSNNKGFTFIKKEYSSKEWDAEIPQKKYFDELKRVSNYQIIWGANFFAEYIGNMANYITWFKMGKSNNPKYSDTEFAYCSKKGVPKMIDIWWNGFGSINSGEKRTHPTQKPVKLYEWLLMNYAKEGDKILDTHLGSGSIAIACHNRKFDLTACELDKEYFDKAIKRIKQHTAQQTIFDLGA
jgi:site-specific DNA-methyltransferase (adenine-specific)